MEVNFGLTFLWIVVILLAAKISGGAAKRIGQPEVMGELLVGVVMGGIIFFDPIKSDPMIAFLAEFGVIILLFQVGLESKIEEMRQVGKNSFAVAVVGMVVPFVLGACVIGPLLWPELSVYTYIFIGATLTATSVGITARVFQDLGKLQIPEAKIVLGAAVIDDILGLILLAVAIATVTVGSVSLGLVTWMTIKAVLFVGGAIVLGSMLAPWIGNIYSRIHSGVGTKLVSAVIFCLLISYLAQYVGLAMIIGAFVAGLVLKPVHFGGFCKPKVVRETNKIIEKLEFKGKEEITELMEMCSDRHVEDLIKPIGFIFIPIFFVLTGMMVNLETLFDLSALIMILAITAIAIFGKAVSGLVAGKGINKSIVGWGMVPRGEVGLIFATIGMNNGVFNDQVFSAIVAAVIFTTFIAPMMLNYLLKKEAKKQVE